MAHKHLPSTLNFPSAFGSCNLNGEFFLVFSCSYGNIALLHYAVCFVPLFLVMVSLPFIYWKAYRKGSYLENKKSNNLNQSYQGCHSGPWDFSWLLQCIQWIIFLALWASVKSKNKRKSGPLCPFPKSAAGIRAWFLATFFKGSKRKKELPGPGRRDCHMKGACQKFWIKPLKETNLGVAQPILPPKRDHFKLVRKQKMYWKYIIFLYFFAWPQKRPLQLYCNGVLLRTP